MDSTIEIFSKLRETYNGTFAHMFWQQKICTISKINLFALNIFVVFSFSCLSIAHYFLLLHFNIPNVFLVLNFLYVRTQ